MLTFSGCWDLPIFVPDVSRTRVEGKHATVSARDTVELTPFISVKGLTIESMLTAILNFETPLGKVTLLFLAI